MKTEMTPERRAELHEERKALLERARAVRDENRAKQAREREISQIAASARFAPASVPLPARARDEAAVRREAIADYEEARAEAARNAAPEDLAAIAARAVATVPEPPPLVMPPIVHEGAVAPPRIGEPEVDKRDNSDKQDKVDKTNVPGADRDRAPDHEVRMGADHRTDDNHMVPERGAGAGDDFERFLAAQDAETREFLSDVELRVIFETETKRAQDERKAEVRKAAAARAQRHAKATAGLLPAEAVAAAALRDRLAQKVEWTVNMPEAGNSGMLIDEGIRINGRLMQHGERVRGTLAEYESYRAIEWAAHQNELDFQGRGKMSKLRQTATGFINMRGQTV